MTDSPNGNEAMARRKATELAAATAIAAIMAVVAVTAVITWAPSYLALVSVAVLLVVVAFALAAVSRQHRNVAAILALEAKNTSLLNAAEATATANLARARFIADVSHDLRQPLHALGLFLDALERRVMPGEGEKILARTREASNVLNRAFSALIDLTRVEADTLIPEVELFAIDDLLVRLEEESTAVATDAGLDLRVIHSHDHMIADERLVGHMLRTLLSNAFECGPGRLLLGIRRRGDRLWVELHCSNPGKNSGKWDVLNPRAPARPSTRNAEELDLLVVRRLADLMNLDLRVETKPERGVAIAIGVPRAGGIADIPLRGRSILLVADEARRRAAHVSALASAGAVVHVACNLRQADHAARSNRFELLVTDFASANEAAKDGREKLTTTLPSVAEGTPPDKIVSAVSAALKL